MTILLIKLYCSSSFLKMMRLKKTSSSSGTTNTDIIKKVFAYNPPCNGTLNFKNRNSPLINESRKALSIEVCKINVSVNKNKP